METMQMETPAKCLKLDGTASLTLTNVNPLTTAITITSKNVLIYTEPNAATKLISGFPDSDAGQALQQQTQQDPPGEGTDQTQEKIDALLSEQDGLLYEKAVLEDSVKVLTRTMDAATKSKDRTFILEQFATIYPDSSEVLNQKSTPELISRLRSDWNNRLKEATERLTASNVRMTQINGRIKTLNDELQQLRADPFTDEYIRLQEQATEVYNAWRDLVLLGDKFKVLETTMKDPCLSVADLRERVAKCGQEFMQVCFNGEEIKLAAALESFQRRYEAFLLVPSVSKHLNENAEERTRVTGLKDAVNAVRTEFSKHDYKAIVASYHAFYNSMRSDGAYIIRSLPVQAVEDFIEFEVKVEARSGLSGACEPREGSFTYKVYICGGVKVDFGTGPVALLGVQDESYRLQTDPNNANNSFVVANADRQDVQPALMATIHISKRTHRLIKPDLMLGGAIDMTEFENVTLLAGAGIMLGRDPWVSIHAGPVVKPVQVLKGELDFDRSFVTADLDENALTEQRYKVGWFVGVSFLFPKRK
ncbi:MAG: hypothetical protein R2817_12610 [Flavobacteriales bacterium]